jgi:hypothetical protein
MFVRYSTPHVHYPQLNSSRACLPTNFQKFKWSISFCFRWFCFAFFGFVLFRFHFVDFVSFRFVFVDFVSFRFVSCITRSSIQVGLACRQTFRSSNVIFLFVFECVSVFMNYKVSGGGIFIDWDIAERHYARYVGTLPNKGNNNGTVLQNAFKRESPQSRQIR